MNIFKRMGSASSSVRAVSIDQACEDNGRSSGSARRMNSGKEKELKKLNERLVNTEVLLEQVRKENEEYKAKVHSISVQLETAESENERLLEKNQLLEEQLESFEHEQATSLDVSQSLKMKDQEMSKLLAQLQATQDTHKTLKQKYKTKLQTIRADYGRNKQEQSLKIFELKDEISALRQENEQLQDNLTSLVHTDGCVRSAAPESDVRPMTADSRSNIIIELSTQISEQEYRIGVLEEQLKEKDLLITELKAGKLSPRDAHSIIALEAEKASQEMNSLVEELKTLKRKKKKSKSERHRVSNSGEYNRETSTLSRDSGAMDLSSPKQSAHHADQHRGDTLDPYTLYAPSHSDFSSTSTWVT